MNVFEYLLNKMLNKFENSKKYAQEIGYYEDENSIFLQDKINVLKNFVEEYELNGNIISNEKDIIVINNKQYKEYIFITNSDYLTLALPSTTCNSCMAINGMYNLSLIFEKILFGNYFLNIFTIHKDLIGKNRIISLINENLYELLCDFYFTGINHDFIHNKRITLFYLPQKLLYIFEYYFVNNYSENDMPYFIKNFFCYNENKIKNYFIPIEKMFNSKINVYDLINNEIKNQDEFKYYTHKIKMGLLLNKKNFEEFKNFLENKKINYKIIDYKINFLEFNDSEMSSIIAKEIAMNYPELKKHFLLKYDKINKIIDNIYGDLNVCPICYYERNKKGHLFCDEMYEILDDWYFGLSYREEEDIWHKIKQHEGNYEFYDDEYYNEENYEEQNEEIL